MRRLKSFGVTIFCILAEDPKKTTSRARLSFWIDSTGTVRWMNLTENIAVRARPEQVLRAFDQLIGQSRSEIDGARLSQ